MFHKDTKFCVLDYETFSEASLKRVGAYEYSKHPSTEVLCVAWRIGTLETLRSRTTKVWAPGHSQSILELLDAFKNPSVILVAQNAYFEQVITKHVLARQLHTQEFLADIPLERWVCTAALAAALAIPRNLEGAGQALGLSVQKDMEGHRLMLRWAKPRKPSKKNPATRLTKEIDPVGFEKLLNYCVTDIDTEVELLLRCPPLTPTERQVWLLDQKINWNGFRVDRHLVNTILTMIDLESKHLLKRCDEITDGVVRSTKQRDATLQWLEQWGCYLPDLRAGTVAEALKTGLAKGPARKLLQVRAAASKSSTAKYTAFKERSTTDGRLRDILKFHGASTGRWSGAGVQVQNLPRPTLKQHHIDYIIDVIKSGPPHESLSWLTTLYSEPMSIFSNLLRSVIIAPKGKVLDVADYSAIEARVVFWLANHEKGLQAYREKRKLYEELAAVIFGVKAADISKDGIERFVGKQATLGCGFGMGAVKFQATCQNYGQVISEDLAQRAVKTYREVNRPVVVLWSNLEKAAVAATENPGKKFTINHTTWWRTKETLWCQLPSGRRLAYMNPEVVVEETRFGEKPVLYHHGIGFNKKWMRQKTWGGVLTENVTQAVARDIMANAMLLIDRGGWDIAFTVHDELISERDVDSILTHEDYCELMQTLPAWAEGLPLEVEGWHGTRYRKG